MSRATKIYGWVTTVKSKTMVVQHFKVDTGLTIYAIFKSSLDLCGLFRLKRFDSSIIILFPKGPKRNWDTITTSGVLVYKSVQPDVIDHWYFKQEKYIYIKYIYSVFKFHILLKKNYTKHNVSRLMAILSRQSSLNNSYIYIYVYN